MEIHWRNSNGIPKAAIDKIEARLQALAESHGDLIDVRISIKPTAHHRHGGHEVTIACHARRKEIVAARIRPEVGLALTEAVDALEKQVHKLRQKRRSKRTERPAAPPYLGIVDSVNREEGYGFILTDDGEKVYFHRNAVHGGLAFDHLEEGLRVALNVEPGEKGPQATTVDSAPPDAPVP
ncbi:MAG: HPF/RaiA family ribosome-associated protein [Deltaproteobacteria bacterium]|nr:HPF/RaiA family ribosome-associated protein [Deltaproteobacteria bacterium]